jgi:S-layer protein (TIGR01567 family)
MMAVLISSALATDFSEIRGPVAWVENTTYTWSAGQAVSGGIGFAGFYYDIDDNIGTESLTMTITGGLINGASEPSGLIYRTEVQEKGFEFKKWGSYSSIGFMGENYFAGYLDKKQPSVTPYIYEKSSRKSVIEDQELLKVQIDSDDETTITIARPLLLKEGYELRLRSVDVEGNKAMVELWKNGMKLVEGSVFQLGQEEKAEESTFLYKSDPGSSKEMIKIAVHFRAAFRSSEMDAATVDGVFQLSDMHNSVAVGATYDKMRISKVNALEVVMDNRDRSIFLGKNMDSSIMGGIRVRTADMNFSQSDPLRFYIYRRISDPGTYEVRGPILEGVEGRTESMTSRDFPGFMYDIDHNIGSERLTLNVEGDYALGTSKFSRIEYSTGTQRCDFKYEPWGAYSAVGYLGEKCFAGYLADQRGRGILSQSSHETFLMSHYLLSMVLIDSDEQKPPITKNSVIRLEEGYELRVVDIQSDRDAVLLSLARNGDVIVPTWVVDINGPDSGTYWYNKSFENTDIVTIAVHFKDAYRDGERELVTVDGIWQVSDNFIKVEPGMKKELMRISDVGTSDVNGYIKMDNDGEPILITKNKLVRLMDGFYIRMSDQQDISPSNPLRYYLYKEAFVGAPSSLSPQPRSESNRSISDGGAASKETPKAGIDSSKDNGKGQSDGSKAMPGLGAFGASMAIFAAFIMRRRAS